MVILDDRLLIDHLLSGSSPKRSERLATTSLWYFRACRAAVLGAGGKLSGPFERLGTRHQQAAIRRLLELPAEITLPDPRDVVPQMAAVAERHPKLNLLNLEAVAFASDKGRSVLLSPAAAAGLLPAVLDAEGIAWRTQSASNDG